MGLFDKIKNILFEDDEEEMNEMPVYSKEDGDTKEVKREEKKKEEDDYVPIQTDETSRFRNVKRDFDFSFDEDEVLDEIKEPELIPEKEGKDKCHRKTIGVMLGFTIMMILDVALG